MTSNNQKLEPKPRPENWRGGNYIQNKELVMLREYGNNLHLPLEPTHSI